MYLCLYLAAENLLKIEICIYIYIFELVQQIVELAGTFPCYMGRILASFPQGFWSDEISTWGHFVVPENE